MCSSREEVSRAGVWLMPLKLSPYTVPKIASLRLPTAQWRLGSEAALVRSEWNSRQEFWVIVPEERPVL